MVDDFETVLWNRLVAGGIPTLGVCRAVQILNVVRGGTLHQHLPAHRELDQLAAHAGCGLGEGWKPSAPGWG